MRFAIFAAALLIAAMPALAQTNNSSDISGHSFGSINCPQPVPCPDNYDSGNTTISDLNANADSCVAQYFGYSSPDGLFENYGLDPSGCLTAKPNAIPKGVGVQLFPRCCVAKQKSGSCSFHCDLVSQ